MKILLTDATAISANVCFQYCSKTGIASIAASVTASGSMVSVEIIEVDFLDPAPTATFTTHLNEMLGKFIKKAFGN